MVSASSSARGCVGAQTKNECMGGPAAALALGCSHHPQQRCCVRLPPSNSHPPTLLPGSKKCALMVQYSLGSNFAASTSRSQHRRRVTDCTRPARAGLGGGGMRDPCYQPHAASYVRRRQGEGWSEAKAGMIEPRHCPRHDARVGCARTCRAGALQLAPQQRRDVEAHQVIQRPARQVGLHELRAHLAEGRRRGGQSVQLRKSLVRCMPRLLGEMSGQAPGKSAGEHKGLSQPTWERARCVDKEAAGV